MLAPSSKRAHPLRLVGALSLTVFSLVEACGAAVTPEGPAPGEPSVAAERPSEPATEPARPEQHPAAPTPELAAVVPEAQLVDTSNAHTVQPEVVLSEGQGVGGACSRFQHYTREYNECCNEHGWRESEGCMPLVC